MNNNSGKKYENFVAQIQQALFDLDTNSGVNNIQIELNKKIIDRNDIEREFDIYWEFEYGGHKYKTIIECKDYSTPISIEKIDALIGKTNDISDLKLIFATKTGYQSGAAKKAEKHNIELLIVREFDESDWSVNDGVREIILKGRMIIPPVITSFVPMTDEVWLEKQGLSDEWANEELKNIDGLNNEVFIHDLEKGIRYSIYDLQMKLLDKSDLPYGQGNYSEQLNNAFLENMDGSHKVKMSGYQLTYQYDEPIVTCSIIKKNILGLVENFHTKERKFVSTGMVQETL